jgi:hypothetical protein
LGDFKQLEFPFTVSDDPLANNKDIFTKGFSRIEFLRYLNTIKEPTTKDSYFYYGAKTHYKDFNILIYRISNFGEAPALDTIRIVLVVFNSADKMISKMTIGGMETENKLINCKLNSDLDFTIMIFNGSDKLLSKQQYFIDMDGKIKKHL